MQQFSDALDGRRPLLLSELRLPAALKIAVLAPHPDDFDAIGVSMRHLAKQGHEIHVAVLTCGASGVQDDFSGARTRAEKAALREAEQRASCAFFGLPENRLRFLRLWEESDERGQANDEASTAQLRAYLLAMRPDMVFLPHGNDSNATHRRTYTSFRSIAEQENLRLVACLNGDAKTLAMRVDLLMCFGEQDALWKAELLRCHHSQQARNLNTRNMGFDERVLAVNRTQAAHAESEAPYAEAFEIEQYG